MTITGWWEIDPQDREYHFHHKVDYGYCPDDCRTSDVSATMPGYQMTSPKGTAMAAATHQSVLTVVQGSSSGTLTWTELRTHIEAPERAPGIEYVDQNGAEDKTMWFGRAANVTDRGNLIIIDFKSVCDDLIMAELEQEYGIDGVVLPRTSKVIPATVSLPHPRELWRSSASGGHHTAFIAPWDSALLDDNCNMPWHGCLRFAWAPCSTMGQVGMIVGVRGQYSFASAASRGPRDWKMSTPCTRIGRAFRVFVDVAHRLRARGVHQIWIAP